MEQAGLQHPLILAGLIILMVPLAGFLGLQLLKRNAGDLAGIIYSVMMGILTAISGFVAVSLWKGRAVSVSISWFELSENVRFSTGFLLNRETGLMMAIVCSIATAVGVYSIGYMRGDTGYRRYFSCLSLFTFSMLGIVLSNNLLQLFMFWELVGLSSYLLINHWYTKPVAAQAARKAFIVNRVGDVGFLIGIAIAWSQLHTLQLDQLVSAMGASTVENGQWLYQGHSLPVIWITLLGVTLFLGAAGKSAQFPLQVWLPDAMAGPTPVSALIHAATMVAAGVFLIARIFPLLSMDSLTVMAVTGSLTAFMGAVAALTQYDIKKVLAYSTISQLGYMVMGMGVGAYDAAIFHLFTHAFFKAGLFLAAGSVIYALHGLSARTGRDFDHQDMRNMGGLRKILPYTFWSYILLSLALVGIPFFSGFLSKDAILSGTFAWAEGMSGSTLSVYHLIPYLAIFTVALTAYYMARQVYLIFLGSYARVALDQWIRDPAPVMNIVVIVLAVMSVGLIWSFNPVNIYDSWFFTRLSVPAIVTPGFPAKLQPALVALTEKNHGMVSAISMIMILSGFLVAYLRFRKSADHSAAPLPSHFAGRLSWNNFWMDPVYRKLIVRPVTGLSRVTRTVDVVWIDGILHRLVIFHVVLAAIVGWFDRNIVDGVVALTVRISRLAGNIARAAQGGNIQRYVATAVFLTILLIWLLW